MKYQSKSDILKRYALSPRCRVCPSNYYLNRTHTNSWKNRLNTQIEPHYQSILSSKITTNSKRLLELESGKTSAKDDSVFSKNNTIKSHVIDVHIGEESRRQKRDRKEWNEWTMQKKEGNERMSTVVSFDSSVSLKYGRRSHEKEEKEEIGDEYHRMLKEEERKYLLSKFMEHYEKVHHYKF